MNVQQFGQTERYLTGRYDLEVLSIPRIYVEDVEIRQSHTTTIEIPLPGIAVIEKKANGYGGIFLEDNNELKWVYNFRDNTEQRETLFFSRNLPGNFQVKVFQPLSIHHRKDIPGSGISMVVVWLCLISTSST